MGFEQAVLRVDEVDFGLQSFRSSFEGAAVS